MRPLFLFLHLAGVVLWVGGMFFVHFCLRPVAVAQLPPPQRLPLMAAVLGRFLPAVAVAIVAILVSGFAALAATGFAAAPIHWHVMAAAGLLMTFIYGLVVIRHFPRLQAGIAAQDWPAAGAAMERIRPLVATNLAIGAATIAIATLGARLG